LLAHSQAQPFATPDIPVRRFGTVPDLHDDSSGWEIQSTAQAAPRTIAEFGAAAVFASAVAAALVAGTLIYRLL